MNATLQYVGLTPDQVQALLPGVLLPATSTTSTSELKTRKRRRIVVSRSRKEQFAARHAEMVQRRIREAVPAVELKDRRLMELCLKTAVAHNVTMSAILSRLQLRPVVAARAEFFREVNVRLSMSPSEIARMFNYSVSSVIDSLSRS